MWFQQGQYPVDPTSSRQPSIPLRRRVYAKAPDTQSAQNKADTSCTIPSTLPRQVQSKKKDLMDVSRMLSAGTQDSAAGGDAVGQNNTYPSRQAGNTIDGQQGTRSYPAAGNRQVRNTNGAAAGSGYARTSPAKKDQKHVVFQLIDPQDPRIQARLPMRVMISPHDPTDSIITTVKNFYGLYEYGVSFENKDGISIIAAYDNFENDMTVHVRTVSQPQDRVSLSPKKPTLGAPFEMRPQGVRLSPSRSHARSAGLRSMSPHSEMGRRSASAAPGGKSRLAKSKSKENSVAGDADGYSSDDGANGSVTSSRRSKNTEVVNAEISVDNIVEGGRRKRAFESSELPLFVPPQVPMTASNSSISPQRRGGQGNAASPYAYSNQHTFSYTQPLPSPQSYGSGNNYMQSGGYGNYGQPPRQLRGRTSTSMHPPPRYSNGSGVLPTPDPTVGSVISDEDVALQLMRLGDATNFSHGRTSTSTVDDALSGKAEAPSSDEEEGEEEDVSSVLPAVPRWPKEDTGPQRKKQRMQNEPQSDATSGDEYEDQRDESFMGDSDDISPNGDGQRRMSKPKGIKRNNSGSLPDAFKAGKPRTSSMVKPKSKTPFAQPKVPMSPASLPSQSRKASVGSMINFQHQLGVDEEDLSTKPRCQRCRKSKKGCDRQRPCGRCKDAGIGIEGCVSEDEGNGRKGRYGRHMGVPVKKDEVGDFDGQSMTSAGGMSAPAGGHGMPNGGYFLAPAPVDKSKKRKR